MIDQAEGLRRLVRGRSSSPKILTVASGKGGVGKTTVSANLGLLLASRGLRVCLFDADLGLPNLDLVLGLNPKHTVGEALSGDVPLRGFSHRALWTWNPRRRQGCEPGPPVL